MASLLLVRVNAAVAKSLALAQQSDTVDEEDKLAANLACSAGTIDWKVLRRICSRLRDVDGEGPWLHELCSGNEVVFPATKERKKSPKLEARLKMLQDQLDNQRYQDMVADITVKERQAADRTKVLPSFRLQASFGLHVITVMATLFAMGYYCGKVMFGNNTTLAAVTGTVGMTGGLLVETTLLIIRTNRPKKGLQAFVRRYSSTGKPKQANSLHKHAFPCPMSVCAGATAAPKSVAKVSKVPTLTAKHTKED